MKACVCMLTIMCLCTAVFVHGRTVTVDAGGFGDYTTIQAAIDDANDADIVQVMSGTYPPVDFLGKDITVTSLDPEDACVVAATVIDANGSGSAVTFEGGETGRAVLTGFTITGGVGKLAYDDAGGIDVYWGGGICCDDSSPTIVRNVISDNHCPTEMEGNTPVELSYGGGIVCITGEPTISRNIFKDNSASFGGAVAVIAGDAKIVSNLIYENSASYGGAVMPIYGGQIFANTMVENDAELGGGACMLSETFMPVGLMSGNIICNSTEGGGLYADANSLDYVLYNDLYNNTPADYVEMPDLTGVAGNIRVDPCFVNATEYDFALTAASLCIDTGDPCYVPDTNETDFGGMPRIYNSRIDIGCYEYNPGSNRVLVNLRICPGVVNLKSRGRYIMAFMTMPEDITPDDINDSELLLFMPGQIQAKRQFIRRSRGCSRTYIMALFDRSDCMDNLTPGLNEVQVTGRLGSGQVFYGIDQLRVIPWHPKLLRHRHH